jgi:hypothetical protein
MSVLIVSSRSKSPLALLLRVSTSAHVGRVELATKVCIVWDRILDFHISNPVGGVVLDQSRVIRSLQLDGFDTLIPMARVYNASAQGIVLTLPDALSLSSTKFRICHRERVTLGASNHAKIWIGADLFE